jgi:hypothetical protein
MTKIMIDAEGLKLWLLENSYVGDTVIDQTAYVEKIVFYNDLIKKINELATPAPEPQESIFDADGWCWDSSKAPEARVILLYKSGAIIDGYVTPFKNIIAWRPLPTVGNE